MSINTSRHHFSGRDLRDPDRIGYKRKGGFLITKGSCTGFAIVALLVAAVVGVVTYFLTADYINLDNDFDFDQLRHSLDTTPVKLKDNVIPESYRLKITPDIEKHNFKGHVTIVVNNEKERLKQITLHSKDLSINNIVISEEIYYKGSSRKRRSAEEPALSENKDEIKSNISTNIKEINSNNVSKAEEINLNSNNTFEYEKNTTLNVSNSTTLINNTKSVENSTNEIKEEISKKNISENINKTDDVNNTIPEIVNTTQDKSKTINTSDLETRRNDKISVDVVSTVKSALKTIKIKSYHTDNETELLTINLDEALKQGMKYTLEIFFEGKLSNDTTGFFVRHELDNGNKTQTILATQMQPTDARKAFPCFDQPNLKATFEISLKHPKKYTAYSVEPVKSEDEDDKDSNNKWTNFDITPKMSTYVTAFALTDFPSINTSYQSKDGTSKPIRIICSSRDINKAKYALDIIPKLLDYFENFFGIAYVLDKLDVMIIPNMAVAGMENWGLITCDKMFCLHDEQANSTITKLTSSTVLAHEIAHQWFGNLVTMEWWNDLWLNEAFATYMQYVAVDKVMPGLDAINIFKRTKQSILRSDALTSTEPLAKAVEYKDDIYQKFNEITYMKGAHIIEMLNFTLGDKLLSAGIKKYLEKGKYSNAVEADLWSALNEVASKEPQFKDISIEKMMETWTKQSGFPVVSVTKNNQEGTVTFKQQVFTTSTSQSAPDRTWIIPVSYRRISLKNLSSEIETIWLNGSNKSVSIKLKENEAVYVNVENSGYYRVNYDVNSLEILTSTLQENMSPPFGQLVADILNAAYAGMSSYNYALSMVANVTQTHDYPYSLREFSGDLHVLGKLLKGTMYYKSFQNFILKIITPALEKFEYGNIMSLRSEESLMIASLLRWECESESSRCVTWATQQFQQWMQNPENNEIKVDLRPLVYETAVRFGGRKEIDFLLNVLSYEKEPVQRDAILLALGSTRDESLAEIILQRSFYTMDLSDSRSVWSNCQSKVCRIAMQQYIINNWETLRQRFSEENSMGIREMIHSAFQGINEEYEYDWFKKFVRERVTDLSLVSSDLLNLNEMAKYNLNWKHKYLPVVGKWLADFDNGIINKTWEVAPLVTADENATRRQDNTTNTQSENTHINKGTVVKYNGTVTNNNETVVSHANETGTVKTDTNKTGTDIKDTNKNETVVIDANKNETDAKKKGTDAVEANKNGTVVIDANKNETVVSDANNNGTVIEDANKNDAVGTDAILTNNATETKVEKPNFSMNNSKEAIDNNSTVVDPATNTKISVKESQENTTIPDKEDDKTKPAANETTT